jgi:hypothetical protein
MVIGPGLGAMSAFYLLTITLAPGWMAPTRWEMDLTTPQTLSLTGVFLIAALVAAPIGVFLGARFPIADSP